MTNSMTFFQIDKNGNKNARVKSLTILARKDCLPQEIMARARRKKVLPPHSTSGLHSSLCFFYERVRSKMQYDYTDYIKSMTEAVWKRDFQVFLKHWWMTWPSGSWKALPLSCKTLMRAILCCHGIFSGCIQSAYGILINCFEHSELKITPLMTGQLCAFKL